MIRRLLLAAQLPLLALACSPAVTPPKTAAHPASSEPPAKTEPLAANEARAGAATNTIVAVLPERCAAYQTQTSRVCSLPSPSQGTNGPPVALAAIDAALTETDALARDRQLVALEGCNEFEPGLIVGLRAELLPPECADGIVEPWLTDAKITLSIDLSQLLRGQAIGARLLRAEDSPPLPKPPFSRDQFNSYLKERIRPWYLAQSQTVYNLAAEGAKLSGFGKAITAVEAGLSDLRFVDNARKVPLPEEMNKDPELVELYEQGLEDALEPRKIRGRDAILVGLLHLGQQGVLEDPRLYRARAQLTRLFSGSRVDALDGLLLPELPPLSMSTPVERLAARLPSFFADRLLAPDQVESTAALRALLERGLPPKLRQHLERRAYERPEIAQLFARALLQLGCRYFHPADFTRATIILGTKGTLTGPAAKEAKLIAALAQALQGGPENAAQLMLEGPMLPDSMGKVAPLELLAKEPGELGGIAAYDAGHLMSVIPQREPNPAHWEKAAGLFDQAAKRLVQPKQKTLAKARAADARATAAQIRSTKQQVATHP